MLVSRNSSPRRWLIPTCISVCGLILGCVLIWRIASDSPSGVGGPLAPSIPSPAALHVEGRSADAVADAIDRATPGELDGAAGGGVEVDMARGLHALALEELAVTLENHLVMTLHGGIDVGGMIDIASSLMDLEVDRRAVPEPTQSGSLSFPILGTPEGMRAQLVVRHADGTQFAKERLSLRVQMDPTSSGGVERDLSEVYFTCWRDREGRLKDFSILTTAYPSADTTGSVPLGVTYRISVDDPNNPNIRVKFTENGLPFDVPDKGMLIGQPLDHDSLNRLNEKLLHQYAKVAN